MPSSLSGLTACILAPFAMIILALCVSSATQSWTPFAKLSASDSAQFEYYGSSIVFDNTTLLIGARQGTGFLGNSGVIFAYQLKPSALEQIKYDRTNLNESLSDMWVHSQTIVPSVSSRLAQFGCSISLSGDFLAVGAPGNDVEAKIDVGSVYIYHRDATNATGAHEWKEMQILYSPLGAAMDEFGTVVGLTGSHLAVTSPYADSSSTVNCGAVYVYEYDQVANAVKNAPWKLKYSWTPPDIFKGESFGFSLSVNPWFIVIGVPYKSPDGRGGQNGAVYVSSKSGDGWTFPTIIGRGQYGNDFYGFSVSVDGFRILVGSPTSKTPKCSNTAGMVYLLAWTGYEWRSVQSITSPVKGCPRRWGSYIYLSANTMLITTGLEFTDVSIFKKKNPASDVWSYVEVVSGYVAASSSDGKYLALGQPDMLSYSYVYLYYDSQYTERTISPSNSYVKPSRTRTISKSRSRSQSRSHSRTRSRSMQPTRSDGLDPRKVSGGDENEEMYLIYVIASASCLCLIVSVFFVVRYMRGSRQKEAADFALRRHTALQEDPYQEDNDIRFDIEWQDA